MFWNLYNTNDHNMGVKSKKVGQWKHEQRSNMVCEK